jgi:hypothetical protein
VARQPAGAQVALSPEQRAVAHQLARRRVYLFTMFFFLVGTLAAVSQDSGLIRQTVDLVTGAALVAAFAVIGVGWRRQSPASLRRQHNILFGLTVLIALLLPFNLDVGRVLFTAMLVLNRIL